MEGISSHCKIILIMVHNAQHMLFQLVTSLLFGESMPLKVSSNPKSKLQGSQQEGFFPRVATGGRCDIKLLSTPADFQLALRQETSPLRTAKTCVSGYPERPGSQTPSKHSSGR